MEKETVTLPEMKEAWDKYPPSRIEYFFIIKIATNKKFHGIFSAILMVLFISGFIFSAAGSSYTLVAIPTYIFTGLLVLIAIPWIGVWFKQRFRIKKIAKVLGITVREWNWLVDLYNFKP